MHTVLYVLSLFLFVFSALHGNSELEKNTRPLADTEAEASTIIGGCVNALTGTYTNLHNDCTISSAEPLSLMRHYVNNANFESGLHSCWRDNYHSEGGCGYRYGTKIIDGKEIKRYFWRSTFISPTGAATYYETELRKQTNKVFLEYADVPLNYNGLTNVGSGQISGQTNLKNWRNEFYYNEGKYVVATGSGHEYHLWLDLYERRKTSAYYGEEEFHCRITEERRPNGNRLIYSYNDESQLAEVKSVNAAGDTTFASLKFNHRSSKELKKNPFMTIRGSDGKSILYRYKREKLKNAKQKKQFYISEVERSEGPLECYTYVPNSQNGYCLLAKIAYPDDRFLALEYYATGENWLRDKVQTLKAPVGTDKSPVVTYRFSYNRSKSLQGISSTTVLDAYNHKTIYSYNYEPRLVKIERYKGTTDHSIDSTERFYWGDPKSADKTNLLSHTLEKASGGKFLCCRSYHYDENGNPEEEQLWGNLTGKKCPDIIMDGNYPSNNGCDCHRLLRKYSKDGFNLLLEEIEPNGKKTICEYLPRTNLISSKRTIGEEAICLREFFQYDKNAVLIRKVKDNGTGTSQDDLKGVTQRVITQITSKATSPGIGLPEVIEELCLDLDSGMETLLKRTVLHYDARAHVVQKDLYDCDGILCHSSYSQYDKKGQVVREDSSKGLTVIYEYDGNGNRTYTKGPNPDVEIFDTYDFANRRIRTEERHRSGLIFVQSYLYDYLGNVVSSVDSYGNETKCTYNEFGKPVRIELPSTLDEDNTRYIPVEIYAHDHFGNKISHTDASGYTTRTSYTIWGHPEEINHPDGTQERFEYTIEGQLSKKIEKNGSYTLYSYDLLGRKTKEELYGPDHEFLSKKGWSYDAFHLLSETDANGNGITYTYDSAGRKATETHVTASGNATSYFTYDSLGRLQRVAQPYGDTPEQTAVQIREYDVFNNLIEERTEDSLGSVLKKKRYVYDLFGNCIEKITYQDLDSPLVTTTVYDSCNKPIKVSDALSNATHYSYNYAFVNEMGARVLQKITTDPKGIQTIEIFDVQGKRACITKRNSFGELLSKEVLYHDRSGNLACWIESCIIDGSEKYTVVNRKRHGPLKRVEAVIEAEGTPEQKIVRHAYNQYGQQQQTIKPNGIVLNSVYDAQGRLFHYSSTDGSISYRYTYDNNSNLVDVHDELHANHTKRSYNEQNKIIQETLGNELVLSYEYDPLGRRTQVILPDHSSIKYHFNEAYLNEIERFDNNGQHQYLHKILNRNLSGQATQIQLVGSAGTETRQYDLLSRRIGATTAHWGESIPDDGYDVVGNLLHYEEHRDSEVIPYHFTYDDLQQMQQENSHVSHEYAYDSLNNCVEKDGVPRDHNALNQLLSQGGSSFVYDLNGNLIECHTSKADTNYAYDALDRLIEATKSEVQADKLQKVRVLYHYDHFNRRIAKESAVWDPEKQIWIDNDRQRFIYVEQDEIGVFVNDELKELRILGEGQGAEIGSAVAMELGNQVLVPIHNLRGDISCVLDAATGEVVYSFLYSAFGEQSQAGVIPWGFCSKRYDPETQLVYFGRRYYSPEFARWTTADPIGFADGPNLYAYVRNSAITHVDLYGLYSWSPTSTGAMPLFVPSYSAGLFGVFGALNAPVKFDQAYMRGPLNQRSAQTHYVGDFNSQKGGRGFTNGICNSLEKAISHAKYACKGDGIDLAYNPTNGFLNDARRFINSIHNDRASNVVPVLNRSWSSYFERSPPDAWYIQFCHSEGAANVRNALKTYDERRNRIMVVAIAPSVYIDDTLCGEIWHYCSRNDPVPWIDIFGRLRNQHTTTVLEPHKDSHWFDHDFQSPTYEEAIQDAYDYYLDNKVH